MVESAVSLVIQKLISLLVQEAKLLSGIHEVVTSIRREMDMIQSFLKDADRRAEKDDMSNVPKTWVKQVREEAYHIEDVIDRYILHFKVFHITMNLKARHVIASEIQSINRILKDIRKSGERYGFNAIEQGRFNDDAISDTWYDPRMASLFIEESEVVGIESHRCKLINWLIEGPSKRMVFSVVGIGGLGKTTLVKKVCDNDKVASHFGCRAWITVDIIKQLYKARKEFAPREIDTMKVTSLIEELKHYLCEQMYVVIFEDIWDTEFWEHIKCAFLENDKGNRIIITTRNEDVAPFNNESLDYYVYKLPSLPFEKALELFCKKAFQRDGGQCPPDFVEFSRGIVETCGGLPLAIVAIGGLFSTNAKVVSEWSKVLDSLSSEFKTNSLLRSITRILSFRCFLYFGMFPEDCSINCARLTRLWIAEGFVKEKKGLTLEEVAQDYLNQLIRRSLVQVDHEVILSRSKELNINLISIPNYSNFDRTARRLSILDNVNTPLQNITCSQTRSILILGVNKVPNSFLTACFANFKLMKTIDFEGAPIDYVPKELGNLFHLRYLSLRDTKVHKLPKSTGKLHSLETLDLKRSLVSELPTEINGLLKLRYLAAYYVNYDIEYNVDFRRAVKMHSGIGCLQSLQKLFTIEANNAALITELGSLGHLRKLQISEFKKENGCATSKEEVLELQSISSPPPLLQTLNIVRISLYWSRLMDDSLKFYDGYGGEQLHIEGGGFQKLKILEVENVERLNRLIIDEGALPLLENLEIASSPQLKEAPSGIHYLKNPKSLEFYEMPTEFVLRLQPDEGPNFGKVKHVASVRFWYRIQGERYKIYKLGDPNLLKLLQM
ncbi:hypothetical protein ACB092_06G016700 [Castanea dentata]